MSGLVQAVLSELRKHDVERVEEVDLLVGKLTFLGHDQLRFAFEILVQGTVLEGARLEIDEEEAEILCRSCGYEGPVDYLEDPSFHQSIPSLLCPKCQGRADVTRGGGCSITSLRVVER